MEQEMSYIFGRGGALFDGDSSLDDEHPPVVVGGAPLFATPAVAATAPLSRLAASSLIDTTLARDCLLRRASSPSCALHLSALDAGDDATCVTAPDASSMAADDEEPWRLVAGDLLEIDDVPLPHQDLDDLRDFDFDRDLRPAPLPRRRGASESEDPLLESSVSHGQSQVGSGPAAPKITTSGPSARQDEDGPVRKRNDAERPEDLAPRQNHDQTPSAAQQAKLLAKLCVGTRLAVFWPDDDEYYPCVIDAQRGNGDGESHVYGLRYDDGDEEVVDLAAERFKIIGEETCASSRGNAEGGGEGNDASNANATEKRRQIMDDSESSSEEEEQGDDSASEYKMAGDDSPVPLAALARGTKVLIALHAQSDKEWLYYAEIKAVVLPTKKNRRKKPKITAAYRGYAGWQRATVAHTAIVHVLPAHREITELARPLFGRSFREENIGPYRHGQEVNDAAWVISRILSTFTRWNQRYCLVAWKGYPSPFDYTLVEESMALDATTALSVGHTTDPPPSPGTTRGRPRGRERASAVAGTEDDKLDDPRKAAGAATPQKKAGTPRAAAPPSKSIHVDDTGRKFEIDKKGKKRWLCNAKGCMSYSRSAGWCHRHTEVER